MAKETQITEPSRVALNHWAAKLKDRQVITDFWNWLETHQFDQPISEFNIEKLLDQYHEINRKKLDNERRALLDQQRALNDA